MSRHHSRILEAASGRVDVHVDVTAEALGHVEQYLPPVRGFPDEPEEPRLGDCVAGAVGLENHRAASGAEEYVLHDLLRHAGVDFQYGHPRVEHGADLERLPAVGRIVDAAAVVLYIDTGGGKGRVVRRGERVEAGGVDLGAAVAPVEVRVEADAHFGHHRPSAAVPRRRYLYGRYQVLLAVRARPPYRKLASREYHGLVEVVEHETHRGGAVGHGVGAVEYHESVVVVVPLPDDPGYGLPHRRLHVGRVYQRREGVVVDAQRELAQFRHLVEQAVEVERPEGSVDGVFLHSYRASRVDEEHG